MFMLFSNYFSDLQVQEQSMAFESEDVHQFPPHLLAS